MKSAVVWAVLAAAAAGLMAGATAGGPRWRLQYFYDMDDSSMIIQDLAFSSPQRGIAVGILTFKRSKPKGVALVTRDGGANWAQVPVDDIPVSLFVLNDNVGWMVGEKGLYRTDEAGRSWKRVKRMHGILRVNFQDENHGWMTGAPKLFEETRDGGKTWKEVEGVKELAVKAENTYFDWMEWATPTKGIVLGANIAPRRESGNWMEPEKLSRRREWPGLNVTLETNDAGKTWKPQTAPTFGRFHRFKVSKDMTGALSLIRFVNTFQFPSEVYLVDGKGKSSRVYREPNRNVTDLAWFGKGAMLAAVEPPGKLYQLPIPGRLHVIRILEGDKPAEMKVDYRAFGTRAILATVGAEAWIATDSGQILKLMP